MEERVISRGNELFPLVDFTLFEIEKAYSTDFVAFRDLVDNGSDFVPVGG